MLVVYFNIWIFSSMLSILIVIYIFLTAWAEGMELKFKDADPIAPKSKLYIYIIK